MGQTLFRWHLCCLIQFFYFRLLTSQASRHKSRKHKLRRCRFRAIISAKFNYSCCPPAEQGKIEKNAFWTGFTRFTQIFILNQETVFIGVNQCLIKLLKLLSDTELHGFTQIFIFFFSSCLSLLILSTLSWFTQYALRTPSHGDLAIDYLWFTPSKKGRIFDPSNKSRIYDIGAERKSGREARRIDYLISSLRSQRPLRII